VDRRRFDADPDQDPTFNFAADADPYPYPTPGFTHVGNTEKFFYFFSQQCQFTLFFFLSFSSAS
jgi:hypothetical protein